MSFNRDPYTLDEFWVKHTLELLSNPYLTPEYRRRVEKLNWQARSNLDKKGTERGHYPRQRK